MTKLFNKLHYFFTRKSKWNYLFVLILIFPFFWFVYYKNSPIKRGNYTIGHIDKIYWPIVNAKTIMYSYTINNIEYTTTDEYNSNKKPKVGMRYLVQFSLEDPSFSDIFQDIPIPDSIKEAPSDGWKELPEWGTRNKQ